MSKSNLGQLIAQTMTPPAEDRTIEAITGEILDAQRKGGEAILTIGRCLNEAKDMLPHGEWLPWLAEKVGYSEKTAQNFMRLAREFSNPQALADLGATKALKLLALPREEREKFVEDHTIILDELRPKVMTYQDLLRILDPFGIGSSVKAPSRYHDKPLAADLIIITSPYAPYGFWAEQFSVVVKHQGNAHKQTLADQGPDGFAQLERRVSATIMVQPGTIDLVAFSDKDGRYNVLSSRVNPYLFVPPAPRCSSEEVFKKMFD